MIRSFIEFTSGTNDDKMQAVDGGESIVEATHPKLINQQTRD